MSKEKVAAKQEKQLKHVVITAENLSLLEAKLQILNPYMVKYVFEVLDEIIDPVYKED